MKRSVARASLRTKIIAWSFIPTAIILVAVALFGFYAYQGVAQELVIGRNRELTRLSANQLTTDMTNYTDLLTTMTRNADIFQGDPLKQAAVLQLSQNRLAVLDAGIVLLNQFGRVTAAEPPQPDLFNKDWSDQSYFRQIVRSQQPAFSDITTDLQGLQSIAVAVPILSDQGDFRGVAVGMFRLGRSTTSAFYGSIVKLRLGENARTYLVDSAGRVIYSSSADFVGRDLHDQPVVQRVLSRQDGVIRTTNLEGAEILASYAPVPGTPWGLIIEDNWAALLAANRGYGPILLLLLALGILVPAFVVMIGVKRITGPVKELIAASGEVADGNYGHQIDVHTGDELEELARQFNVMSVELRDTYTTLIKREERLEVAYATLEQRVAERTHELATLNAVATVVSRSLDLNEIAADALEKTMQVMGMEAGAAYRLDETSQDLVMMVHRGLSEQFSRVAERFPLESILTAPGASERRSVVWRRADYPEGEARASLESEGLQLLVACPLTFKDRLLGGLCVMTHKDRAIQPEELALLTAIGQQVAIAVENARLFKAEQDRHAEAERRRCVAESLREILATLNSNRTLDEILGAIVVQASQLLGCDAIAVYELDRKIDALRIGASQGLDADYVSGMVVRAGQGVVGQAFAKRQPVILRNSNELLAMLNAAEYSAAQWALLEGVVKRYHSLFAVPLVTKGEAYGAMALYYRPERAFSDEEIALVMAFANQAALAIENAGLRTQAAQSAVIAERSRLARDLHDAVTQSLYGITLYAEAAARLLNDGKTLEAAEHLREVRDTSQEALREMRLLIFELRPLALEKMGLVAALRTRLDAVEIRGGVQAELRTEGIEDVERLPYPVQEELYHIVQEALNNALKHANAHHVTVHLSSHDSVTSLEISDDGVGFTLEQAAGKGGLGLSGMMERAQRIGATLCIESAPAKGTKVRVELSPMNGVPAPYSDLPQVNEAT